MWALGENHARRIVRRVDQDHSGFVAQVSLEMVEVREEVSVGVDEPTDTAVVFDVEYVFRKVGLGNEDFVTSVHHGLKKDVDAAGGTAAHDDVLSADIVAMGRLNALGHPATGIVSADVTHVTVVGWLRLLRCLNEGLGERRGWWGAGIAQSEVKNVLGTDRCFQAGPFFKHLPNPRGRLDGLLHGARN